MVITGSIVTHNNEKTIEACLTSILRETKDKDYEFKLYVYDNASTDGTLYIVRRFPGVRLICDTENKGFGAGHNGVIKRVKSDYHFVINPDISVDMDTIGKLAEELGQNPDIGLITPRVLNTDGTEQYLPKFTPTVRYVIISKFPGFKYLRKRYTRAEENLDTPTDIKFCTGCFFGAKTAYLKKMRGFSNKYFMYCEDADLSERVLRDGKRIVFFPDCTVYHNWQRDNTGSIKGIIRFMKSLMVFFHKWGFKF